jgi:hypothetical protein
MVYTHLYYVIWRNIMSARVEALLKEGGEEEGGEELAEFKRQAKKQSKSLSAWMR